MITCQSHDYDEARRAHPDEPIMTVDTREVHMPGHDAAIRVSRWQLERAMADPSSRAFEPQE